MIVAAAIKRNDKIYTGERHFSIIKEMIADGCEKPIKCSEQGFIDDTGKFYNRLNSKRVAKRAKQIPKDFNAVLLSEDLW